MQNANSEPGCPEWVLNSYWLVPSPPFLMELTGGGMTLFL